MMNIVTFSPQKRAGNMFGICAVYETAETSRIMEMINKHCKHIRIMKKLVLSID